MNTLHKSAIYPLLSRWSATLLIFTACLLAMAGFGATPAWAAAKQEPVSAEASGYELPFTPDRAIDTLAQSRLDPALSRWYVGAGGDCWLKLDLGTGKWVDRWTVEHMGPDWNIYYGAGNCNTKAFKLQKSDDGVNWTDADAVAANTAPFTDRSLAAPFKARYVRLYITQGNQDNTRWASIKDFSVYGKAFTVRYTVNGVVTASTGADAGDRLTAPAPPEIPGGFRFAGWYKDAACTQLWNFEADTVRGNLDLYAKFIPPLTLAPPMSLSGIVGESLNHRILAAGGQGPYVFSLVGGSLPAGVTLNADGTVSGTPTAQGVFTFDIQITDAQIPAAVATGSFTLTVNPAPVTVDAGTLPEGYEGEAYTGYTFQASGGSGSYRFEVTSGTLPTGMTLDNGGFLTGCPTAAGNFAFTVTAMDITESSQPGSRAFSLTVNASPMTGIEVSAGSTTYHVGDALDESSLVVIVTCRNNTTRPLARSEYEISGFDSSRATERQSVMVTAGSCSDTFDVSIMQNLGMQLVTAPRLTYADQELLDLTAMVIRLHHMYSDEEVAFGDFRSKGLNTNLLNGTQLALADDGTEVLVHWADSPISISAGFLRVAPLPVIVADGTLPAGTVDEAYIGYSFQASGGSGSYRFEVTSGALPTGMTLESSGSLTGCPTAAGNFAFTVTAMDITESSQPGSRAFTLTVNASPMTGIEVSAGSTTYHVGDALDESSLVVIVTYRNNTTQPLARSEYEISGFDSSRATERQSVMVTAESCSDTFNVSIQQDIRLEILTQPRLSYTEGEFLDLSALRVCLHDIYSDETVVFDQFGAKGLYTDPAGGSTLSLSQSGTAVAVVWSDRTTSANTEALTVSELQLPDPGHIRGTVTDSEGNPLEGAVVTVNVNGNAMTENTDADGNYCISDVPPGTYTVAAELTGYSSGRVSGVVVVSNETTESVNLMLTELLYATDILTFQVPGQVGDSAIDTNAHTVTFHMPYGTDVAALVPELTVSEKATVTPGSGESQNFTDPVTYTVQTEWSVNLLPMEAVPAAAIEPLAETPVTEAVPASTGTETADPPEEGQPDPTQGPTEEPAESEEPAEQPLAPEPVPEPMEPEANVPVQDSETDGAEPETVPDTELESTALITLHLIKAAAEPAASDISGARSQCWTVTCIVDPEVVRYYTVTVDSGAGGEIKASKDRASAGDQITVTATPDSGKRLKEGTLKYLDTEYHLISGATFTMPACDVRISAEFEAIPVVSHGGGGGGSSNKTIVPVPPVTEPEATLPEEDVPLGAVKFYDPYVKGYPDQSFHPTDAVTRAQLAAMFARILKLDVASPGTFTYTDVGQDNWAYGSIQAASQIGLFAGYSDGTFRPEQPITRGEMAMVLSKYWAYMKVTADTKPAPFDDITGHWAEKGINESYNAGAMNGFEDGTFRPDAVTVREQAVVMINRIISRPELNRAVPTFSDVPADRWSYGNVEAATSPQEQPVQ